MLGRILKTIWTKIVGSNYTTSTVSIIESSQSSKKKSTVSSSELSPDDIQELINDLVDGL